MYRGRAHIPSYFLHISSFLFVCLQHLGPKGGGEGTDFKVESRKFHTYPRSGTRNFTKSHSPHHPGSERYAFADRCPETVPGKADLTPKSRKQLLDKS